MNNVMKSDVKILLDKERSLRYDFNAMIHIDERYDGIDNVLKAISSEDATMGETLKAIRFLIYVGLIHEDLNLTEEEVGSMLVYNQQSMLMLTGKIMEAFGVSLPEPEENEAKNE